MKKIFNFVLFQLCWFLLVQNAANDESLLACSLVLCSVLLQNIRNPNWKKELQFLSLVTAFGVLFDLIVTHFGIFAFNSPGSYPLWGAALWLNFGTLFSSSIVWLHRRYLLSAVLGFIGGPPGYYAGDALGAIALGQPVPQSLIIIGLLWALATPLLLAVSSRLRRFDSFKN